MKRRWVLVALSLAVAFSGCASKEERLAAHMDKARILFAHGESAKARVEIKNALQIEPKLAEAYLIRGMIEEQQANIQQAFGNFIKAVEFDPSNLAAAARLGRVYLMANDLDKAEASAKSILDKQVDHPLGLTLRAGVLARRGKPEAAIEMAQRAIAKDPGLTDAYALVAGAMASEGKVGEAISELAKGILRNPKAEDLRLVSVELMVSEKRFEDAQEQLEELIHLRPTNLTYRASLARLHLLRHDPKMAEAALRDSIAADPKDDQRLLQLIDFLVAQKRKDQAEKELAAAVEARPEAYPLRFALASLYRTAGKSKQLESTLLTVMESDQDGPEGVRARGELAELRLAQGKTDDAQRLVGEVLAKHPRDNKALQLHGQMALDRGDPVSAISDLRTVFRDQPNSLPVAILLARAHLANKEPQLAVETVGGLIERAPNDPALRLVAAEIKTATGDSKGALDEIAVILRANSKDFRALGMKAEIEVGQKQWRSAEETVAALCQAYPDNAQAYYRAGLVYQVQGKLDQAAAAYETALQKLPGAIEPLTQLANIDFARHHGDRAAERLAKAVAANPKNFLVLALQGRTLARQGKYGEAEQSLRRAVEAAPKVSGTYVELALHLAGRGDYKKAAATLEEGIKAIPSDPRLRLNLAEILQLAGDPERAIVEYEAVLKERPAHDLAANNLASLLLDKRADEPSFERALVLAKRFENSSNPAYADTLGWAYFRMHKYDLALLHLRRAAGAAPGAAVFQYHIGLALLGKGDKPGALAHLKRAVDSPQKFPGKNEARKNLELAKS